LTLLCSRPTESQTFSDLKEMFRPDSAIRVGQTYIYLYIYTTLPNIEQTNKQGTGEFWFLPNSVYSIYTVFYKNEMRKLGMHNNRITNHNKKYQGALARPVDLKRFSQNTEHGTRY